MKNVERSIYIVLIIILVGVICCGTTYIVVQNKNNQAEIKDNNSQNDEEKSDNKEQEENKDKVLKDGVKLLQTLESNDKVLQEYEIVLNGNKLTMPVVFSYQSNHEGEYYYYFINGEFNNYNFYQGDYNDTIDKINITKIKSNFNETNFQIIPGIDNKNYLGVTINYDDKDEELYIFNDKLELITKNLISEKEIPSRSSYNGFVIEFLSDYPCEVIDDNTWYHAKTYDNNSYIKIEGNKIYFLVPLLDYNNLEESNYGIIEERVYTINNSKLEYKVINTYEITNVCEATI